MELKMSTYFFLINKVYYENKVKNGIIICINVVLWREMMGRRRVGKKE